MAQHRNFRAILEAVRIDDSPLAPPRLCNPLANVAPPIAEEPPRAFGAPDHWMQAIDGSADLAGLPPSAAPPSDDAETISRELGLNGGLSAQALAGIRRRFMWANHPDRRLDISRDLANRRVAIANMLIDRARGAIRTSKD